MTIDTTKVFAYGFAAFAIYFAYRSSAGKSNIAAGGIYDMLKNQRKASGAAIQQNTDKVTEILSGTGSAFGNGWRYFSDGTIVKPAGDFYSSDA